MIIKKISILPGYNKGFGKSQLLYDIEKLAFGETKTGRKIKVNGNFEKRR